MSFNGSTLSLSLPVPSLTGPLLWEPPSDRWEHGPLSRDGGHDHLGSGEDHPGEGGQRDENGKPRVYSFCFVRSSQNVCIYHMYSF